MTPTLRRVVVALAGVLLASAGSGVTAAAESRPSAGACTSSTGVTVVVDFGAAGGGVQTRCAPGSVANGFDALVRAGFAITNVRSQPGFLCQIDAVPTSDCGHVPSASRYWSYWYADRGGSWTYSTSGASRKPPAGSVEGWAFGASDPPAAAPPALVATTTTTRPPTPTTASSPGVAPPATVPGASTTIAGSAGATSPTASDDDGAGVDGSTTSTTRTSAAGSGSDATDDDEALAALSPASTRSDEGSGSATGLIVAGALVAGVSAAALRTARRRGRAAEGDG